MNTPFTPDRLRTLFQNQFNSTEWLTCLQQLFLADKLRVKPEPLDTAEDQGYYWGAINTPDHYHIGLFHYAITRGSVVNRRVGLRKLVEQFTNKRWGDFDAALVVFSSQDHWRLSLICDIDGEATSPKRFTYVFGSRGLLYRTPIERFTKLQKEGITFAKMREAFSVEALSDEFFERYREQYADFVQYVTGKRYVKSGSKWEERVLGPAHAELISAFKFDEKRVRDYIKKMMGRITFLHFLQRKGWMCGDLNYMQHLFERSPYQDDYLDAVLEPLFFGILNTRPEEREALFTAKGWNKSLLSEWKSIPYLNGGLFECEAEDLTSCQFPADYFSRLFQFFSEYNFTIDENDPTDAEVGVDPEMLGKIFENLLEDNKDKGAFYTPKEIVRYMCRESLIAYLVTQSMERGNTNPREMVEASIRDLLNKPEEIVPRMNERQKREFGESLYRLKICDPAIGSGAFPMGLLNELVRLRALIDAWAKDDNGQLLVEDYAALKSEIICNNIYGVDIERGAIDIARLRFWLSIVVDEVTPHTLPNLDYKFMQGNSLITTFNGEYINLDSKQNHANIVKMRMEKKRLYQLKQQYYTATGEQKHQLNVDIKDSILSLIALQLDFEYRQWFDHHNTMHYLPGMGIPEQLSFADIKQNLPADKQRMCDMGSTLRRQLHDETKSLAERAKHDIRFFDWRMMFTEVFEGPNPGFDIVIGNPPYIEAKKLKYIASTLKKCYSIYSGTADLSIYFIELGMKLLVNNGVLSYITTNKFFNTGYGKPVRTLLVNSHINSIINFEQVEVFEDILVSSVIINIQKREPVDNNSITYERFYKLNAKQFRSDFVKRIGHFGIYPQQFLDDREWSFANTEELLLKQTIERESTRLSDVIGINIYRGVTTGYNPAFIIDDTKRDELIAEDERNEEVIKNMLQGRNIRKWYYHESNENLIFIPWHFPLQNSANISGASIIAESSFSKEYPSLYKHLQYYQEELESRNTEETGIRYEWYALQRCAASYYNEFEMPEKIIWGLTANNWAFAYDDKQHYLPSNGYIMTSKHVPIKYLLGWINSKLMHHYFSYIGVMTAGGAYTLKAATIEALPFKIPTDFNPVIEIVEKIIEAKAKDKLADTSYEEKSIDKIIYELYGLTNGEIAIIEKANK